MAPDNTRRSRLKPLNISCTSTNCEEGLHCFLRSRKMAAANQRGPCRSCGADLVDWVRVHNMDLSDAGYTFKAMKQELIRHHFWHIDIDQKAVNHARRKGVVGMHEAAKARIIASVALAEPVRDGRQTPWAGNALYYAQHATASCCRRCIEEWHGIPRGRALAENEIQYLVDLTGFYIEERLPYLKEHGEMVPPIRQGN